MGLHLLGKDPESPGGDSPTVYYDDVADTYILQGWKVADAARLAAIGVAPGDARRVYAQ